MIFNFTVSEPTEKIYLNQEGEDFQLECLFRRSSRARYISLRLIEEKKAILTLPNWATLSEGRNFIQKKENWIRRNSENYPITEKLSSYFSAGAKIWLDEKPRTLKWEFGQGSHGYEQRIDQEQVMLFLSDHMKMEFGLHSHLLGLAKKFLPARLENCQANLRYRSKKCRVGNQKSRWGSCSTSGTICLNWRILLLPYPLGNYVIYHEIAHLKEMNHSKKFWDFLNYLCPNARKLDKELTEVGRLLIRLGHECK